MLRTAARHLVARASGLSAQRLVLDGANPSTAFASVLPAAHSEALALTRTTLPSLHRLFHTSPATHTGGATLPPHRRLEVPAGLEVYEPFLYGQRHGDVIVVPTKVLLMYLHANGPLKSEELWDLVQGFGRTPETGMIWNKHQMKKILSTMRKQKQVKLSRSEQKMKGTKGFKMLYSVGDNAPKWDV